VEDRNPIDCSEIDRGWDDLDAPASDRPKLHPPPARPSRTKSKEKLAAKAAKKAARKAARQAERRARAQNNNRAALKAATKTAKRQPSPEQRLERPRATAEKAPPELSVAALSRRSDIWRGPLLPAAVGVVVLAALLVWFLWRI